MTQPVFIGITELAAEFHISKDVATRYLTEAGIRRTEGSKQWPYAEAATAIRARKDPAKMIGHRAGGDAGGMKTLHADGIDNALVANKQAIAAEQARKLKLQNDEREKRLISRAAATESIVHLCTSARQQLEMIGLRLAPQLSGDPKEQRRIKSVIDAEVKRALGKLSDERLAMQALE